MTLLGGLSDLDILGSLLGSAGNYFQHRSFTHSLIGIFCQAVFFAVLLCRWDRGFALRRFISYLLPLMLHLFCDLLTPFGLPLLLPWSARNYSWDLLGSLNIIPALFMMGSLLWLQRRHLDGWRATRVVWAAWVIYLGLAFTGKVYATQLAKSGAENLTALPTLYSPFNWRAVAEDKATHAVRYYDVDLLSRQVHQAGEFSTPLDSFPVQASLKSRGVSRFLQDHRWPAVRVMPRDKGWDVEWGTLIFSALGPVRGKLVVSVAPDGQILQESSVVDFWDPRS